MGADGPAAGLGLCVWWQATSTVPCGPAARGRLTARGGGMHYKLRPYPPT